MSAFLCLTQPSYADDDTTPQINIDGDVYGGGKEGAVGTGNVTTANLTKDTPKQDITMTGNDVDATDVTINAGEVRTVFGGGQNGRTYGQTQVTVNGGTIGGPEWEGTIHGGVFAAGDGATAEVFQDAHVTLNGGVVENNIYGGGNQALLIGRANVALHGGKVYGNVFGGARMADVAGFAYVNMEPQSELIVKTVFGGNDISGKTVNFLLFTPDALKNWTWFSMAADSYPFTPSAMYPNANSMEFSQYLAVNDANRGGIWNTNVRSARAATYNDVNFFVGSIYGGGNGDYAYTGSGKTGLSLTLVDEPAKLYEEGDEIPEGKKVGDVKTPATTQTFTNLFIPDTDRTYLELSSGTTGYVYGGGNKATVNQSVDLYMKNPENPCEIQMTDMQRMGLQTNTYKAVGTDKATLEHTYDRVFGGNNVAEMAISPNWYLLEGKVNNLYGGGNQGNMTCPNGILVYLFKNKYNSTYSSEHPEENPLNAMKINNLYAGCRMADVAPSTEGDDIKNGFTKFGYEFPKGYASRVYVGGGNINNVYGGNDVSGNVAYGTDVEIHGAISGDVYGGGNGAYPYTDNKDLAEAHPEEWGDYFYDTKGEVHFNSEGKITFGTDAGVCENDTASLTGLNLKRPHVASTLVHIAGEGTWLNPEEWESKIDWLENAAMNRTAHPAAVKVAFTKNADGKWQEVKGDQNGMVLTKGEMEDVNRVYVLGGVYCGGNSATVYDRTKEYGEQGKANLKATLQIGRFP